MAIGAAQQIDDNSRTINSNDAILTKSQWTFVEETTGATGVHTLFTVTGDVTVKFFATCQTNVTGDTGTIKIGVPNDDGGLIAQTTGTGIDAGHTWVDNSPGAIKTIPYHEGRLIASGADIIATIETAALTGGVVTFYCLWRPLSDGASITATTPA